MDFFYRNRPWYAGQFVRHIVPKIQLTRSSILFFTTVLNKLKPKLLSVLVRHVNGVFINSKVKLPITANEKIDFEFIDTFMEELETERVAELRAVSSKKINSIQTAYLLFKNFLTHPEETQQFIESKETIIQSDANNFDPSRKPAEEGFPVEEMQEQRQEEQGAVEESSLETEETTKTETGSDTDIDFEDDSETESKVEADSQDDNNADEDSEVGSDDEAFNDEEKTTETEPLENFGSEELSNDVEKATDDFLEANEPNLLFKKPLILCLVEGRECELLYKRKSSFGVFVKWDDGVEEEIPAEDVQINRIIEA